MTKRRRERDRPKAGPESLYNPNKRVHLSYAESEEEDTSEPHVEEEKIVSQSRAKDIPLSNAQEATKDRQTSRPVVSIAQNDDDYEPGVPDEPAQPMPATEQARKSPEYRDFQISKSRQTKKNADTSGCIQVPDDDDGGDESDQEVARYMRAVQSERNEIPQILFAGGSAQADRNLVKQSPEDGEEAAYEDGAFFARTRTVITAPEDSLDPQTVFTERLIQRFQHQRTQLHIPATVEELTALSDDVLISFPSNSSKAKSHWLTQLRTNPPLPAQIRSIDQSTALQLLELIADSCLVKATDVNSVTSAWVWSLLARLDDVSNLYNDEIYPLRQLGKKALFVHLSFANPEAAAGIEALDQEEETVASAPPSLPNGDDIEPGAGPTANTQATLDMILTVVGQVFGQKDLLQFRQSWDIAG
jgi:hypothetical protein